MKKLNTVGIVFMASTLITACAGQGGMMNSLGGGWTPTVDTYNDPNAYRLNQDMAECGQIADQSAGGTLTEGAKGAAVGGLIGGAGGAALGAITGDPGKGAAIGAAALGLSGGAYQGYQAREAYKRAYSSCLRQRGHRVIN
ncbi:glycine zipper family protein [Methylobacter luteus]|jgi:outer membrane lipoprotein SlyB|uniref:glycine zipper family protein n=1 Tax=Methylobacter luteus TaxID=415 RepID=UPI00040AC70F|nr:glycine zipper family protein [Methylobacter luteus]